MNLLVIGAGNMGNTYAGAMVKSPLLKQNNLMILDNSKEIINKLSTQSEFDTFLDPKDCVPRADVIFIAVKPHHSEALFEKIAPMMTKQQIVISIMAGVSIETIQKSLKQKKVVRAMPNLPAQVGKGMTTYIASEEVSRLEQLMIEELLKTTGETILVQSERYLDASTSISGSGPAYVYYFMQSMLNAAGEMGFSEQDAKHLVRQTFEGAIHLFKESNLSPQSWMDKVASKGGTTEAALKSMDDNKVNDLIREAAFAAFRRAEELGKA